MNQSGQDGEESTGEDRGYLTNLYVKRLSVLTESLESGSEEDIHDMIGELTTLRESALYQDLGKLTREIHDTIRSFGNDDKIAELTEERIPDAKERLTFIVKKTDEAAHKTMEGAEATMVLLDSLSANADTLRSRWEHFRNRELSKEEFINLNDDIFEFLSSFNTGTQEINSKMTEIMLAQDYQDITGQMIQQVVTMVQDVEEKLVRLVAISGADRLKSEKKKSSGEIAEGPQLPTVDDDKIANSQGDVDDILAGLGF